MVGHFVSPPDYKMAQGVSVGKLILVTSSMLKARAASTLVAQRQTWLTCLLSTLAINRSRSRGEAELITELRHMQFVPSMAERGIITGVDLQDYWLSTKLQTGTVIAHILTS